MTESDINEVISLLSFENRIGFSRESMLGSIGAFDDHQSGLQYRIVNSTTNCVIADIRST